MAEQRREAQQVPSKSWALDVRTELSSERLSDVQTAFDPMTISRLESVRVDTGWRCLVVGAGRSSLVRWLADRVGELGQVVAADVDASAAGTFKEANIEVRAHDIVAAGVEPGAYDLAHSRHILMSVKEPGRALENMMASLRPGGWLVVEEGDFDEPVVITREHPGAGAFERVWHAMTAFLSDSIDVRYGMRLPRIGWGLGLVDFHTEAVRTFSPGGDPGLVAMRLAVEMFREQLLASTALWEDDLDLATAALADPSFVCGTPLSYAIFGRKAE
jgi:SAM-dependent methyltransferase